MVLTQLQRHFWDSGSLKKCYGVALLYVGTLWSQSRERSDTKPSVLWLRSRTVDVTKIWYRSRPTLGTQRSQNKRAVILCIGRAESSCLTRQRDRLHVLWRSNKRWKYSTSYDRLNITELINGQSFQRSRKKIQYNDVEFHYESNKWMMWYNGILSVAILSYTPILI